MSFHVSPGTEKAPPDLYLKIQDRDTSACASTELAQLRATLQLDPSIREFKIVHGMLPQAKNEIALRTRSISRLLTYLSLNVEVPPSHVAAGLVQDLGEFAADPDPQITVHSGPKKPCDCFAAVHYRGNWFWIDSSDTNSKRSMTYLKRFLALADTTPKTATLPALTIRAN